MPNGQTYPVAFWPPAFLTIIIFSTSTLSHLSVLQRRGEPWSPSIFRFSACTFQQFSFFGFCLTRSSISQSPNPRMLDRCFVLVVCLGNRLRCDTLGGLALSSLACKDGWRLTAEDLRLESWICGCIVLKGTCEIMKSKRVVWLFSVRRAEAS